MSSLRLALKLSLQENPDVVGAEKQAESFESLDAIVGRKRKGSLDKKEPRKRSKDDSSLKSRSKNGDDSNKDGGSIAGDSITSMGMHADEASVSSNALNKDDEFPDDDIQSTNNVGNETESLKIKEENTDVIIENPEAAPSMEIIEVKVEPAEDAAVVLATESEDKQDEVVSPRKAASKKKRLLKGLDVSEKDVADALMERDGEEDGPRYQSNRAAAMIAKTKLNVTTASAASLGKTVSNSSETATVPTGASKEPSKRGGWNRGTGRGSRAAVPQQQIVPIEWVQCDKCSKWRSVSPSVDIRSLPDVWVCADNTWDAENNHCEAPEQTEDEAKAMYADMCFTTVGPPSIEPPRVKRETSDGTSGGSIVETPSRGGDGEEADNEMLSSGRIRGGNRGRNSTRGNRRGIAMGSDDSADEDADAAVTSSRANRRQVNYAEDDEEGGQLDRSGRLAQRRRSSGLSSRGSGRDLNASFAAAAAVASVNWVQCNKCGKWRKVPESIDVKKLPDTWLCQMNTWNPSVARCSAREEADEPAVDAAIGSVGGNTPAGGRTSGRGGGGGASARSGTNSHTQAVIASMIAANSAAIAAAANAPPLPPGEIRQIKWVQCERKNCKKWRKVPAYIDMDTFPEKWFCEMNFWNLDRASCDVTEDHDSDEERKKKEARNNRNLLLGNNKGGAQLSYRRIIYGTDAKVRPHFSEKSKLGNGIFTYPIASRKNNENDDDETNVHYNEGLEPVRRVTYWWSTAHDDRLHGLHPHCLPAIFGAATSTTEPTSNPVTAAEEVSTPSIDLLPPLSSSSAKINRGTDDSEAKTQQVSYMMETASRLYQEATTTGAQSNWKATNRNQGSRFVAAMEQVNELTLYQRMTLENNLIQTLLQSTIDVHILFIRLMELIASARFLNPVFEACRYILVDQKSAVVDILHRLEEKSELEVGYTRDNQLVITLLPSLDTLRQELAARRGCFDTQVNGPLRARRFDPRQRKCFQNNSSKSVPACSDAPPASSKTMLEQLPFSESTLRTVAAANNIPIRTTADGEFLWQFPASGANAMVHSSAWTNAEAQAILPTIPPPLTADEKQLITNAINAATGGAGKVYLPATAAAAVAAAMGVTSGGGGGSSSSSGLLANSQGAGGAMGGRGRRGNGAGSGAGRGRGRGRGNTSIGPDGQERAAGGRGVKRATKVTADAAATLTSGHALPSTETGGADGGVKKVRRAYTRRKIPNTISQDTIGTSPISEAAMQVEDDASNNLSTSPHEIPPAAVASRDNVTSPAPSSSSSSSSPSSSPSPKSSPKPVAGDGKGTNDDEEDEDDEEVDEEEEENKESTKDEQDDEEADSVDNDDDGEEAGSIDNDDDEEEDTENVEAVEEGEVESESENEAVMDVDQVENVPKVDSPEQINKPIHNDLEVVENKPIDSNPIDDDEERGNEVKANDEDAVVGDVDATMESKSLQEDDNQQGTVTAEANSLQPPSVSAALSNEVAKYMTNMDVDE